MNKRLSDKYEKKRKNNYAVSSSDGLFNNTYLIPGFYVLAFIYCHIESFFLCQKLKIGRLSLFFALSSGL
ncbi:hypothetical protein BD408DRAFT_72275 [Parasitella parasitica]|nr:hypothetical protein BD408DRAFT_72275 [Parasitella parasitica]